MRRLRVASTGPTVPEPLAQTEAKTYKPGLRGTRSGSSALSKTPTASRSTNSPSGPRRDMRGAGLAPEPLIDVLWRLEQLTINL